MVVVVVAVVVVALAFDVAVVSCRVPKVAK